MSINGFKMGRLFFVEFKSTRFETINIKERYNNESITGNKRRIFMILHLFDCYALEK